MLALCCSTDIEIDSPIKTAPLPISDSAVYYFVIGAEPVQISSQGHLEIDIFHSPKLHWKRVSIDLLRLEKTGRGCDESKNFKIKVDFRREKRFNVKLGYHHVIMVTLIELQIEKQSLMLETLMSEERHKLVLQTKLKSRRDMMYIRTVYLGRAQSITTTSQGDKRCYVWKSGNANTVFKGVGVRTSEDMKDIEMIQTYPMTSPRLKDGEVETYEGDNDGFSNPNLCLPIDFSDGEAVELQVFNLKFNPPKFMEVQVRWAEFLGSKNNVCRVVYDRDVTFFLKFEVQGEKKIMMTEVEIKFNRYVSVLNHMGDHKGSKTV